jgi:hypothetical protein
VRSVGGGTSSGKGGSLAESASMLTSGRFTGGGCVDDSIGDGGTTTVGEGGTADAPSSGGESGMLLSGGGDTAGSGDVIGGGKARKGWDALIRSSMGASSGWKNHSSARPR